MPEDTLLCWLRRDAEVLASLEIMESRSERRRGLLGRDHFEGAALFPGTHSVHSFGMRFDLDVAFLDKDNVVIKTVRLPRNRVTSFVFRANAVLEAQSGAFGHWELKIGDQLEISDCE